MKYTARSNESPAELGLIHIHGCNKPRQFKSFELIKRFPVLQRLTVYLTRLRRPNITISVY